MDFDSEEDKRIDALKQEYGIKQTTELIRFLITSQYREIQVKVPTTPSAAKTSR
jgi:hypothetical protein